MPGPGLALFYGGLVRRKNVLGTMMQSFALMALVTVIWAVVGYSLAFGGSGPYLGDLRFAFLRGVGSAPNADYAATIPQATFMVYQLMFAIITPALISGAFAERMKFSAMIVFTTLWSLLVYFPMAHMVWGKGGLLNAFSGGTIPCFDFAGGTVVHITSGVSALVCALYLGKRVGYPELAMKPHSMVLSFIGACLLWVGLRAGGLAARHERFRGHPFRRGGGYAGLDRGGMDSRRETERAGRYFRRRGGVGGHHAGFGLCPAVSGAADRIMRRHSLLHDGDKSQGPVRL
jgi:hypothetical protein